MSLCKNDLDYYATMALSQPNIYPKHLEIAKKWFKDKNITAEQLAKKFKRPVVKIDDAIAFTVIKIRRYLRDKEKLSKEEIKEVIDEIFGQN